jgi:hypothetical protein
VQPSGREQLLLCVPELQKRLGKKYCDEAELLPLFLMHGVVRHVRTIELEVRPLGGDNFRVILDAANPSVGEAKTEISRAQGTAEDCQELYTVAIRADGAAVREDDAEPEPLDDDRLELAEGQVVAMAVKEPPLLWRTFPVDQVEISVNSTVVTHRSEQWSLVTTGIKLTQGRHFCEVKLLDTNTSAIRFGVSKPNLKPNGAYWGRTCNDAWFMGCNSGSLYGNGKFNSDTAGGCKQCDRVGLLLDLDDGSLRFFKNGKQYGPGYPAGSVTGPVVIAVNMHYASQSVQLLTDAQRPAE